MAEVTVRWLPRLDRKNPFATPSAVAADLAVNPIRADCRWDQPPDGLRKMESIRKGAK